MDKNNKNEDYFLTPDGQKLEIPKEGSLGLLAYGARGVEAWRNVRKKKLEERIKKENNE